MPTSEICCTLGGFPPIKHHQIPNIYFCLFLQCNTFQFSLLNLLNMFYLSLITGLFSIFPAVGLLLVTVGPSSYLPTRAISAQCTKLPSSGQDPAKWYLGGRKNYLQSEAYLIFVTGTTGIFLAMWRNFRWNAKIVHFSLTFRGEIVYLVENTTFLAEILNIL